MGMRSAEETNPSITDRAARHIAGHTISVHSVATEGRAEKVFAWVSEDERSEGDLEILRFDEERQEISGRGVGNKLPTGNCISAARRSSAYASNGDCACLQYNTTGESPSPGCNSQIAQTCSGKLGWGFVAPFDDQDGAECIQR
ncbi:hypothetical protein Agabi119p4_6492 [Agaricus bisporus var. burnettii]|uniref:Uncharacterized protein n=1 Tax=Agaricus bisporus var. burnettii TaxID=192524 RepID=A0A8H7CAD4_AGABI|nr:hypothetical protein Agabi119p4_6492 [Agaricus bisporus var. burnettii]